MGGYITMIFDIKLTYRHDGHVRFFEDVEHFDLRENNFYIRCKDGFSTIMENYYFSNINIKIKENE